MKRYIKCTTELSTSMQDLIDCVADEWKNDMEDQDCRTYKEFCDLNAYEASDIREEIRYMVEKNYDGWMYDDGTVVIASDDSEMPYGKFKQAVINKLKEL